MAALWRLEQGVKQPASSGAHDVRGLASCGAGKRGGRALVAGRSVIVPEHWKPAAGVHADLHLHNHAFQALS